MKNTVSLNNLDWYVEGHIPNIAAFDKGIAQRSAIVRPIDIKVPGSVQAALLKHGIIKDWLVGNQSLESEWVENRQWIYKARFTAPFEDGRTCILHCEGLDYCGWIEINDKHAGDFCGTHMPHSFDITSFLTDSENELSITFDLPPRHLGQFYYSSRVKEWKTRFNYGWDWTPRLVQVGIIDDIYLEITDGEKFSYASCLGDFNISNNTGILNIVGDISGQQGRTVRVSITKDDDLISSCELSKEDFCARPAVADLDICPWQPNLEGEQPLYTVTMDLFDDYGNVLDSVNRTVGFRHIEWQPCEGAPEGADNWLCVINGKPIFLQGVNFEPVLANYADVSREEYAKRIYTYRDLGCNMFRINGCGFLEYTDFYELCDECGILVWQEFPQTSSGNDNWPPEDKKVVDEMAEIARTFIDRRRHHPSLCLWSGGNELQSRSPEERTGAGVPCPPHHPLLKRLGEVVRENDPGRRYIHTSPSGPRAWAERQDFGKGIHHDVHGPYNSFTDDEALKDYWDNDDAVFRSEMCCPGANPIDIIEKYHGNFDIWPPNDQNPYWTQPTAWWVDWNELTRKHGREPVNLEEYVAWSQENQANNHSFAMAECKKRFPRIGGVLLWGSHDTYPQPTNTSILDFYARPKPVALALKKVWRSHVE